MRLLCIDLGDKRTGLAVGDTDSGMVLPLDVLEIPVTANHGRELVDRLARLALEHNPAYLVIGLPLNMDGSEGPRAKSVRALAARIAAAAAIPLRFHDERLSTADADWQMARTGMTHDQKKAKRDALAAAAILRDHLASLSSRQTSSDPTSPADPSDESPPDAAANA